MRTFRFLLTGLLLLLSPAIALAQTPKSGGTLTYAVTAEAPSTDCHAITTYAAVHVLAPHYSLLLKVDPDNYPKLKPDVAESWTVSPDGLTYTFKIRTGVLFHDGTQLTSKDVKATFDRIRNPPAGIVSIRKELFADIASIEAPDPATVVMKLREPDASFLDTLALPYNCLYSADRLAEDANFPAKTVMGSGPFVFVEHRAGSHWTAKRFDKYWEKGKPYLDGFKAVFIKSQAVVTALQGGQIQAEFRSISPGERNQLVNALKDKITVQEAAWVCKVDLLFNSEAKPFDNPKIRQALSMAIDRWGGSDALSRISILKFVGGVMRPGYAMSLPESELTKLPGFSKDIAKSREEAKKLLDEAGVKDLKFKLLNRNIAEPYTPGAVYSIDQWRRVGVVAEHEQLETKLYQDRVAAGDFDVAIEFQADFMDDPTAQFSKFLTKKASPSGYSGHTDTKIDDMYEKQRRTIDVAERTKIVREMERYSLVQAYNVPLLWWQRIIVNNKKIHGWYMTPSHYLWQDLTTVWLDQS